MASPILIFPFQEYWLQLTPGARDQIIGGIIVLIVGAVGGSVWRTLRRRSTANDNAKPPSFQPTQQEVVVKIEGPPPAPSRESPPEPVVSKRSTIPRPPIAGFVARRDENGRDLVERLKDELSPEKEQLIVLWGAGGVGKTALAAQTARAMRNVFVGGIVWTSADGRQDFGLSTLLDQIATQLGHPDLRQLAPEPKSDAVRQLLAKATLIVLDNFETISPAEQEKCANWLATEASCPALITSRDQVIRARPVRILAMSIAEAEDFLQRLISEVANPRAFELLDRHRIIQAGDRIPLVLQWVVRRIDSASQPLMVLEDLSHGAGDAANRVFDRSFDLPQLGDDGRAALLSLCLFVPSASRSALAHVAGFGNNLERLQQAIQQMAELLLVETTEGSERLKVEGLTRELARARLAKEKNGDEFRRRFVDWFQSFAEAHNAEKSEDYDALESEKDNLIRALDLVSELDDTVGVRNLARAIAPPVRGFLGMRGYWTEAVKANQQALVAARKASSETDIAIFAHNLAVLYDDRGELIQADLLYNESMEIDKRLNNKHGVATSMHQLGLVAHRQGKTVEARKLYTDSLDILRELNDQHGIALRLHQLAILKEDEDELDEASKLHSESLAISRSLNDQHGIGRSLHHLAILAHARNQLPEARRLYNDSLTIAKQLGNQRGIARTLHQLATLASDEGKFSEARKLYNESMEIKKKLSDINGIGITAFGLALLNRDEGNDEEAILLFEEALRIFDRLKRPAAETVRRELDTLRAKVSAK